VDSFKRERAQTFVEYVLIVSLIGLVLAASSTNLFQSVRGNFWRGLLPTNAQRIDLPEPPAGMPLTSQPPTAVIGGPSTGAVGQTITLLDHSHDNDGRIVRNSWGSPTEQITLTQVGVHTVFLTVWDNDGLSGSARREILVVNGAPVAAISVTPGTTITPGTDIVLSGRSSTDPDGHAISRWEWHLNGVLMNWPLETTVRLPAGTHQITLRVMDEDDLWSPVASRNIAVNNLPVAVIGMTPSTGIGTSTIIAWSHLGSFDPDGGAIAQAEWINAHPSYSIGTHTVQLRVADSLGAWSPWAERTFTVGAAVWDTVSAGAFHTLAIRGGQLFAWGWNGNGQLGIGSTSQQTRPVRVGGHSDWTHVFAGTNHSLAIRGGQLFAWGLNSFGELGLGHTTNQLFPQPVLGGHTTWTHVSGGANHSLAIRGGQLFAWGLNGSGQLGLGNTTNQSSPQPVLGGHSTWTHVSGGWNHSLAIRGGQLFAWGLNSSGELGIGNTTNQLSPQPVLGGHSTWTHVSAGMSHSLAIRGGQLFAWGWNGRGELGIGSTSQQTRPVRVGGHSDWTHVFAGGNHSLAIRGGQLFAWGWNTSGQLGIGNTTNQSSPQPVLGGHSTWTHVSGGFLHSLAIRGGQLFAWGHNGFGGLGIGNATNQSSPQLVTPP